MAVRLIQHARRLLAVPVSFQPSSPCVPSECTRLGRLAPSFPCLAALHTTSLCRLSDSLPGVLENPESQIEHKFYLVLEAVPEVEELLQISTDENVTRSKCMMILHQIAKRKNVNHKEVLNDWRFRDLLDKLHTGVQDYRNDHIINLLRSLYVIGLDSENSCMQSVMVELRWRLRRLSMTSLTRLSSIISPLPSSNDTSWLLNDLLKQVELRWTEITNTRDLVVLFSRLGYLSETLTERLEDKALEFAEAFTPEQSRKIFVALAVQNRRTLPVLRALSFHLVQRKFELAPSVIVDLAFACGRLNFCQPHVLEKMATDLIPKLSKINPADITLVIRSWSSMKACNHLLYEAAAQTCLERNKSFTATQLCSLVLGFATLNFQPRQSEEFFNMIHQRFRADLDSLTLKMQLSFVWSLCVLSQATTPYFQKILDPQFYNQFCEKNSLKPGSYALKFMQINATALLEVPDYQGPLLSNDFLQSLQAKILEKNSSLLQKEIKNVLRSVFPDFRTCSYKVPTIYGWLLDGEVVLDSESKPLAVTDFVAPHNAKPQGSQPLPEGAKRLAIVAVEFSHYLFRAKELLGVFEMNRRHLRAAGFLVVEVPFYEWQELKSELHKQSFLKEKIKKLMEEETAR